MFKTLKYSQKSKDFSKVPEHPYLVRDSLMPNCF